MTKHREKLLDTALENGFINIASKAQTTIAEINKQEYIKLKSFCMAKETTKNKKRQPIE